MISAVELDTWLGGKDFQGAARTWMVRAGSERWRVGGAVDDKVVVVADAELELLVGLVDALSDAGGPGEIEGRSLDAAQLAGGNQVGVDGRKAIGIEGDDVIENIA